MIGRRAFLRFLGLGAAGAVAAPALAAPAPFSAFPSLVETAPGVFTYVADGLGQLRVLAISANPGKMTAGVIRSADGTFAVDLGSNTITLRDGFDVDASLLPPGRHTSRFHG